jgi:hypothetical protein
LRKERLLFACLTLIVIIGILGASQPVGAAKPTTLTANPSSLTITAGEVGYSTITVSGSDAYYAPVVSCTGLVGVTCTTNPNPLLGFDLSHGDYTFQLIINTSPSTPQGTFEVTVTLVETSGIIAPPIFSIQGGSIGPQQVAPHTTITVTIAGLAVGGKLLPMDPFSEAAWAVALTILILIPVIVFTRNKPQVQ